jgi:Flp pilus assembly protein CpaB
MAGVTTRLLGRRAGGGGRGGPVVRAGRGGLADRAGRDVRGDRADRACRPARGGTANGPRRRAARRLRWRRGLAALLAGVAVWAGVGALSPRASGTVGLPTVVAVRDVAAGAVLGVDDLTVVSRPPAERPDGAASDVDAVLGATAAGPLLAREVVVPSRLLGGSVLAGQPTDHVALTVPVLDASGAGARPGARVDLYATGTGERAASDVVVLAVREAGEAGALGAAHPPQVTLSLGPDDATRVARGLSALEAGQSFVVAIRQPGALPH